LETPIQRIHIGNERHRLEVKKNRRPNCMAIRKHTNKQSRPRAPISSWSQTPRTVKNIFFAVI